MKKSLFLVALVLSCGDGDTCPEGFTCTEADGGVDATADVVDGGPDVPASNCTTACEGETPICDEVASECVQCLLPADCDGVAGRPMCDGGSCVECVDSTQCETAEASLCGEDGLCTACGVNGDCMGIVDGDANTLGVCDSSGVAGVCVGCTEATAADDCGDFSCNPATGLCTETERGDVGRCGACVSDGECGSEHGCIEIDELGGAAAYCMPILPGDSICPNVYSSVQMDVTTLSGAGPASYCTFDLAQFSCEGVLSLGAMCEAVAPRCVGGAQCETITGLGEVCTLACGITANCPSTAPLNTCGGGYCGS